MRTTGILWGAALLLCAVLGAAEQKDIRSETPLRFSVTGTLGGEPNTEVLLLDESGSVVGSAVTGSGGRFLIQVRQEGHYRLAIRRNGGLYTLDDVALDSAEPNAFVNLTGLRPLPSLEPPRPRADVVISAGRLSEKVPGKARRLYDQATRRAARGDEAGALERLEEATRLAPNFLEALNDLSVLYMRRQDPARAEVILRRAIALDASSWRPHLNLGILLLHQKKYAEAQQELESAQRQGPASPLPPFHLGVLHVIQGDGKRAETCFSRALEIEPRFPTAQLYRGYARLQAGQLQAARSDLAAYLEQAPQAANAADVRRRLEEIDRTMLLQSGRR
ncbi:MAG TPA: tetratricopeptide repeat protein [Bryobacterales bacterium]|nr:tetratricopeptide repeat protein [Bryobacterales bacterium]